jgi:hypothetical protein
MYEFTEEHRRKLSEKAKGNTAWKGRKHSEETKKKLSEQRKGKKFSPEHIEKLRIAQKGNSNAKGHKLSEDAKIKIGDKNRGIKRTDEFRRKVSDSTRGEKGNNWKGGLTPINRRIRESVELRLWREAVFARDAWTCQHCGDNKGGNLNAHHIKQFAHFPELRTAIENGITLCKSCHIKVHKKKI